MTDREKVIKGLESLHRRLLDAATLDSIAMLDANMVSDSIALLKAQEPRVMTWRDVIGAALGCKPVYIEVKDSEDKELGDDRWAMLTQHKDSITNGMIRAMSSYVTSEVLFADWYNKSWRCWTSLPTEEQRKAVAWIEA